MNNTFVQEERLTVWISSDPSIATVSESGLVTAIAAGGPVTVSASTKGRNALMATTSITVVVGGRITFQSERDGHGEVYVMDSDGTKVN